MDYNDRLWQKKLDDLYGDDTVAEFSISLFWKTLTARDGEKLTKEALLKKIDNCEGEPPEVIRKLVTTKLENLLETIDGSIGWPEALKVYDEFDVNISIKARAKDDVENRMKTFEFTGDDPGQAPTMPDIPTNLDVW